MSKSVVRAGKGADNTAEAIIDLARGLDEAAGKASDASAAAIKRNFDSIHPKFSEMANGDLADPPRNLLKNNEIDPDALAKLTPEAAISLSSTLSKAVASTGGKITAAQELLLKGMAKKMKNAQDVADATGSDVAKIAKAEKNAEKFCKGGKCTGLFTAAGITYMMIIRRQPDPIKAVTDGTRDVLEGAGGGIGSLFSSFFTSLLGPMMIPSCVCCFLLIAIMIFSMFKK
jgi:hypothetical protein